MTALPALNRALIGTADFRRRGTVQLPPPDLLDLPEKAVQFGTGAFLRGFVDPFLDEANRRGHFGGRIVMIGSTGSGRDQVLNDQDGLYTLAIRGVEGSEVREEQRVISSVSRAISARSQWDEVLACARNPELELIFSNTTEVGIALDEDDDIALEPPRSFPGKLTRFLLERARAFDFDPAKGLVVIPCELLERNADRLRAIVLELTARWKLGERFTRWIEESVAFCNTLVDRIVPGTPSGNELAQLEESLGYRDELLTMCEVYRLFAIEGDERLRRRLHFAEADPGIVVTGDIEPYRERKVRLLNGSHTIMVPTALLTGCDTVRSAMQDERVGAFIRRVMVREIMPGLDDPGASGFAHDVLDRFANPFIRHNLFDITLQGTTKMRVRVVPSILRFAGDTGQSPSSIAFGFAAFLLFLRGDLHERRRAAGLPVPADDQAERIRVLWTEVATDGTAGLDALVDRACGDRSLWDADLSEVPGFVPLVTDSLAQMLREGVGAALASHLDAVVEAGAQPVQGPV